MPKIALARQMEAGVSWIRSQHNSKTRGQFASATATASVIHPLDARTVLRPFLTSPALGLRPFIVPVVVKGEVSFLPPKIVSRFLRLLAGEF